MGIRSTARCGSRRWRRWLATCAFSRPTFAASARALSDRVSSRCASMPRTSTRPDYRPRLLKLDLPAFVCTGSEDPWSTAAVTAEIVEHLQRPELVVIDGVGHLPNLEAESV